MINKSRVHPSTATAIAVVVSLTFGGNALPAFAQQQTVNVLIDASFAATGKRFLDEMQRHLAPEAREAVAFRATAVTPSDMQAKLRASRWEMAIISTTLLTASQIQSSAA